MKKEKKKIILLMGYYGFDNLGDEAVLQAIVQKLQKAAPEYEIRALSNKPSATQAAFGIRCYDRWKPVQLLKALLQCEVFVAGGGSLLQDATGTRGIKYYLLLMRAAKLLGKKLFYYAQGIGPINDKKNRRLTAKVLERCDYITVRDNDAAEFIKELGVKKEVFVTCDPVLSLRSREYAPMLPMGLKMGFALRECKDFSAEAMARVADHFAEKGWTIVFLPFCAPNDVAVSKLVLSQMKSKGYIVEDISLPADMMAAISACNFIVGVRLHSLIMAAAQGVPFAALSYDPKIDGFCHEIGLEPAASASEQDAEKLIPAIEKQLGQKGEIKDALLAKQEEWKALSAANAMLLKECADGNASASLQQFAAAK